MDRIADMTDAQLIRIYLKSLEESEQEAEEKEHGTPIGTGRYQDLYMWVWSRRGLSIPEIKAKWEKDWPNLKVMNPTIAPWDDNVKVPVVDGKKEAQGLHGSIQGLE